MIIDIDSYLDELAHDWQPECDDIHYMNDIILEGTYDE